MSRGLSGGFGVEWVSEVGFFLCIGIFKYVEMFLN